MTVKAHIRTTKALHGYGAVDLNPTLDEIDVWFITISESLSNKTAIEVKNILNIQNEYGVWITIPFQNKFWIINNNIEGFNVQEFDTVDLDNIYTIFEVDEALATKADVEHTHSTNDILDLNPVINGYVGELSDKFDLFIDELTRGLINK